MCIQNYKLLFPYRNGIAGKSEEEEVLPKILLMGLRRSGKSSIYKVVFHKMSPTETLFLESTSKIATEDVTNSSFVQFSVSSSHTLDKVW